ncbi:hypothetical protein, partial [Candidatus Macondimonas diazotrophica]
PSDEDLTMSNEYPLYPELTEQGKQEAQKIMDAFKVKVSEIVEEVLDSLYTDVSYHIESDHWSNYRHALLEGFKDYKNGKADHSIAYAELRMAIYKNNRDEIVQDLNQDLVAENDRLRKEVKDLLKRMYEPF